MRHGREKDNKWPSYQIVLSRDIIVFWSSKHISTFACIAISFLYVGLSERPSCSVALHIGVHASCHISHEFTGVKNSSDSCFSRMTAKVSKRLSSKRLAFLPDYNREISEHLSRINKECKCKYLLWVWFHEKKVTPNDDYVQSALKWLMLLSGNAVSFFIFCLSSCRNVSLE